MRFHIVSALISVGCVHGDALAVPSLGLVGQDSNTFRQGSRGRALHSVTFNRGGHTSVDSVDTLAAVRAGRVVAFSAALGSLLQGFDTGVVGGALLFIVPEFGLADKPWVQGLIVVTSTVGSLVGTVMASKLSDTAGRKGALQLASGLFVASSLLLAWSPVVEVLLVGRAIMGVAIGCASSVVPIYIAECAEAKNRGALATVPQLCISSGILLAYAVSLAVTLTTKNAWRLMMGFSLFPALLQAACVTFFLPESPRWLLRRPGPANQAKARAALARLRGVKTVKRPSAAGGGAGAGGAAPTGETNKGVRKAEEELPPALPLAVEAEFAALVAGVQAESAAAAAQVGSGGRGGRPEESSKGGEAAGWAALREPPIRRLVLVCMGLQMFQQCSGINAVVYFTPQTLKLSGVPELFSKFGLGEDAASLLATIFAYAPKIPSLLLAMRLMDADGWGRKTLLKTFVPGMAACLFALAASFYLVNGASSSVLPGALALACLCLYGSFFVLSLGPIPNILTAELFPSRCRSAAMACSQGSQFLFNTVVGLAFPVLRQRFGSAPVFAGFGGVCVLAWFFTERFVPETKGRALEDLAFSASK